MTATTTAATNMQPSAISDDPESQVLAGLFPYPRLQLARGEGCWVWDDANNRYLDFTSGLGVTALGHGRHDLADVLREQFATLAHTSQLYGNAPSLKLCQRLVELSFASKVWLANSGAEANEAAIKFARLLGRATGGANKHKIVAFKNGFHGRTLGALSTTYTPAYREPFEPIMGGVCFADFNDLASVRAVMDDDVCAVVVEPVQGEGGVIPATAEFLAGLHELCDTHDAALVFDEVQCGLGRVGTLFAYQHYGVTPDILLLAKPLAAGLPIGAVLMNERVAQVLKPGHHGSTFAGGPAVCAVANAVLEIVSQPAFLQRVQAAAAHMTEGLAAIAQNNPELFSGQRGLGLMQALLVSEQAADAGAAPAQLVAAAKDAGLLLTRAGTHSVRLLPPLTCSNDEIDTAVRTLQQVADTQMQAQAQAQTQAGTQDS